MYWDEEKKRQLNKAVKLCLNVLVYVYILFFINTYVRLSFMFTINRPVRG